jgi:hypothetical protein
MYPDHDPFRSGDLQRERNVVSGIADPDAVMNDAVQITDQ